MNTPIDDMLRADNDRCRSCPLEDDAFLTVPQLAAMLHVNEKKVYQLAGVGELPGTKVTGKWIFPRQLIEDWLLENSHGGVMHDRLLLGGSDDRLLQLVCNSAATEWQQQAFISYSPSGARHGLRMLDTGRIDACFIHWGASEDSARRHMGLLRRYRNHQSWVIVRCLQRSQGIILNPRLRERAASVSCEPLLQSLASDNSLRWAVRPEESGSMRLLEDWCSTQGVTSDRLRITAHCDSESSACAALHRDEADLCCGGSSAARDFSLPYLPVADVSLDLVMTRKSYFRTLVQDFIARLHDARAHELASQLGGYTILSETRLLTVD